jgi:hypothetical protein
MHIALSYKHTLYTEVAYTNCLISSLNTSVGKTLVPNSSVLFAHPSAGREPYYSGSLSLNGSINPTSIGL